MAEYMNCGTDDERSDFYAFNDYSYCDSSFQQSGWAAKVQQYGSYSIPLFLSEYGCNKKTPRDFPEVVDLYSDEMTSVYSGGLVYEFTEEGSNYGLVELDGNNVKEKDDYSALKKALAGTPNPEGDGGYKQNGSPSKCPAKSSNWDVDMKDDELPATPSGVSDFFKNGAGKAPGLTGGSQDAGSDKVETAPAASGAVTSGATASGNGTSSGSSSSSAAASLQIPPFSAAPLVCGAAMVVSALLGASLL